MNRMKTKKKIRYFLSLGLALCLLAVPALPAQALSLQETYYLQTLYPNLPKSAASYPARLIVTLAETETVTLHGTCGMNVSLTEEEMLVLLKQALSAVPEYKELEDAAQDKHTQSQLTEKLKFTDEDVKEVMDNLLELIGMDDIPGMFNPIETPDIEALNGDLFHDYELVNGAFEFGEQTGEIIDLLAGQGDLIDFVKPDLLPSIQGLLYNGAKISWEEFQKDQQKYKDIATLYQAKQRLRTYYAKVDELVKNAQSENGAWAIRIYDQQVVNSKLAGNYWGIDAAMIDAAHPLIWTADIELVKDDGSFGNVNGTYAGGFTLKAEAVLEEFEQNFHHHRAAYLNAEREANSLSSSVPDPDPMHYAGESQTINSPSEFRMTLEKADASVTLSLPAGVNRTIFELPLSATALEQTEFVNTWDMVTVVKATKKGAYAILTYTDIGDTTTGYDSLHELHHDEIFGTRENPGNDTSGPITSDLRPHINITLVVDML